jgi:hypothetical protein
MMKLRKFKALVLLFAFLVIFAGGFSIVSAGKTEAARCCWVMQCTITPPIICWEVCKPCPKLP